MSELVRPSPPYSWRERLAGGLGHLGPARLLTVAGSVLVVAAGAWWLLRSPAEPVESRLPVAAREAPSTTVAVPTTAPSGAGTAGTAPGAAVVVQAAGAVVRPGVYPLAAGARVADLVAAAGGAAPDAQLDAVALASRLVDGQRVYVPHQGEAAAAQGAGGAAAPPSTGGPPSPVELNTATVQELDQLPGIGPSTAAAIVAYRAEHGPFHAVEELLEIRGIGPARLEQLRGLVRV